MGDWVPGVSVVSSGERLSVSYGPRLGTPALETSTPELGGVF